MAVANSGSVVGLASDDQHRFSKTPRDAIRLITAVGVEGDAHAGASVRHRARVKLDPDQPNLRQVHLLHSEFFDLAGEQGFHLSGGDLGENVLTAGLDLLRLPRDTRLRIGPAAILRVTGLRNPCWQIDAFRRGLLKVAVSRSEDGDIVRRAGVMAVVESGGPVALGDPIEVELPPEPHVALGPV